MLKLSPPKCIQTFYSSCIQKEEENQLCAMSSELKKSKTCGKHTNDDSKQNHFKTSKQQAIASFIKPFNKFVSIKNESTPLLSIRNECIESMGNKNMLGQIRKHVKNNFASSCARKK